MTAGLRVVIAEDHYLFREGVRQLLEAGGHEVVAAVGDGLTMRAAVDRLHPDVVITDIRMPPTHETEGLDAAKAIRQAHPDVGIVVLSQYANALYAFEVFQDGTAGIAYLLKDRVSDFDELQRAIATVAAGGSVIDPQVVDSLMARTDAAPNAGLAQLTERETQVLALMAQGRSNRAIAESLCVSRSAVEKHINAILSKLGFAPGDGALNRRVAAVLTFLRTFEGAVR